MAAAVERELAEVVAVARFSDGFVADRIAVLRQLPHRPIDLELGSLIRLHAGCLLSQTV